VERFLRRHGGGGLAFEQELYRSNRKIRRSIEAADLVANETLRLMRG
jgi:hypothetical protein